jgi:hypothetical protein
MCRLFLAHLSLLLWLAPTRAQEEQAIALHDLLTAAKLPEGYHAMTQAFKVEGKTGADIILVTKPSQASGVHILIEFRDFTPVLARRAAATAYVNVTGAKYLKSGYKLIKKSFPDITKESFEKPISVALEFVDREGKKLWTHQEIFFTDKGFCAQVTAFDPESLGVLTKWVKTIKPTKALQK